ncbi:uncharacterized protein [Misgurnus anguillicaudatus]|uniref:uncharacterized protein isoform X2 n=1 Tax=Misgurnus anguillicaudatus TaxID=75329 RepID=UPI003CCF44F3
MKSAGILSTSGKSKSKRSYVKGSLFFLLLHMFNGTSATTTMVTSTPISQSQTVTSNSANSNPSTATEQMTSVALATTTMVTSTPISQSQTVTSNSANSNPSTATEQMTSVALATPVSQSHAVTSNPETSTHISATGQMTSVETQNFTENITSVHLDSMNTSSLADNDTMLSCPEFTCTDDCHAKFMNKTSNPCPPTASFCELIHQNGSHTVQCSVRCAMPCGNPPVTNCSMGCCNTTDCLNYALFNMSNSSSTAAPTKSTATPTTIKVTVPPTPANNGKKCQSIKCDGPACYKTTNTLGLVYCPIGQDYCMLNKTTSGSTESWQGGCSTDCRKATACSTTVTTCYLECCNATVSASCLKLTGDLNMPSSAPRGPQSTLLLTASLVMLWMMKVLT